MSLRIRAWVALGLLFAFPVLALLGVLGVVAVGVKVLSANTLIGGKIIFLAVPVGYALIGGLRGAFTTRPEPVGGPELLRTEHPALWAELDDVTRQMGQRPVDRVVVQPQVNAFVTEGTGKRELMIGLPLLAALNRAQLRAVLGHEMGHFGEGHTRAGRRAYRGTAVLAQVAARLDKAALRTLVQNYHRLYLTLAMPVLRDYERAADHWSVRLAGSEAAASVHPLLVRLGAAWQVFGENYLPLGAQAERRPSPLEGVFRLLEGPLAPKFEEYAETSLGEPADPMDTHPAPGERHRRMLEAGVVVRVERGSDPAWTLLTGGAQALHGLEAALELASDPPGDWKTAVTESLLKNARHQADLLLDQVVALHPEAGRSLAWALHLIALGEGSELVAPVLRGDIPPERRQEAARGVLRQLLGGAVLHALAGQGRAEILPEWGASGARLHLVDLVGARTDWPRAELDAAAADPTAVPALQARLLATGADLNLALPRSEQTGALRSEITAALTGVVPPWRKTEGGGQVDLVAYDDGLLVAPVPPGERGFAGAVRLKLGGTRNRELDRLEALVNTVGANPREHVAGLDATQRRRDGGPGLRWIPFSEVHDVRWKERIIGADQWVVTASGTPLAFTVSDWTQKVGDIQAAVAPAVAR